MIKEVLLGDLYLSKGGSLDPSKFPDETFEYYSIPAYDTGEPFLNKGKEIGSSKKVLQPGDVVLSRIVPHIRRCWVIPKNNYLRKIGSGEWIVFRSEQVDNNYLKFYLLSDYFNRQFMKTIKGVGGSLMRADPKQVARFKFMLPPLTQQKKIAAILDQADLVRQKTKALIEKYDELAQSLFLDMFGDPVTNPKGWEMLKLKDLSKISSGSTPSRKNDDYFKGTIPWVKTGEVNGKIIFNTDEKISDSALENSSCKMYPKGSLIIAMYGQGKTRGQVGILGIDATTNQACAVIPPSKKMNFIYLFNTLKICYEDLRNLGRGGNQPNLNTGLVKEYNVINPQLELQNIFAKRIEEIDKQKSQAEKSLQKSEDLFNSLLQKAFKGELTK